MNDKTANSTVTPANSATICFLDCQASYCLIVFYFHDYNILSSFFFHLMYGIAVYFDGNGFSWSFFKNCCII